MPNDPNDDCHTPPACLLNTTVAKLYIYSAATRQSGYFTPCNNPASLDTAVARMVIQPISTDQYPLIMTPASLTHVRRSHEAF